MASVTVDSELMTNYISAVPLVTGNELRTVLDENRRPMVFCLSPGTDPKIMLLRRDSLGQSEVLDLSNVFGIPSNAFVQTFQVEQAWSLSLFVCVAWREKDSSNSSGIIVLKPFQPNAVTGEASQLPAFTAGMERLGLAQKIFMSPLSDDTGDDFPDIFVTYSALDQIRNTTWGSDIKHIRVDPINSSWSASDDLAAPENAASIIDVAPARGAYGKGLYVLYHDSQGRSKLWVRFIGANAIQGEPDITFVTSVYCPEDAVAISAFLTPESMSCLLIASPAGLSLLSPSESTRKTEAGQLTYTSVPFTKGIRSMTTAQDGNTVSLWFRTNREELGYIRTSAKDFSAGVPALLLPEGSTSSFSACVAAPVSRNGQVARQMLISNATGGKLSLLEQSSDLGLWRSTPFYAPSTIESTPVQSYTVTMKAKTQDDHVASRAQLFVSASSTVSALLNGSNVLLTKEPTWFDCDAQGSLDFIIPTDSLSSNILTAQAIKDANGQRLDFARRDYDPTLKVMATMSNKLQRMSNAQELLQAKTEAGERLIPDDVQVETKDLEAARLDLLEASKAYQSLASVQPKGDSRTADKPSSMIPLASQPPESHEDLGDLFMDGWNWVKEKAIEAGEWSVKQVGAVWKFTCTIAGVMKKFVLDCVEKVCEAASWIWKKIKVGWEKLKDYVGFIFNWDDVVSTKDTISAILTSGMGYASQKIKGVTKLVDEVCDKLDRSIDEFGEQAPPTKLSAAQADQSDQNGQIKQAQTSTSCTWASERLKNGGAGTSTKAPSAGGEPEAQRVWDDIVVPKMKTISDRLQAVGKEVIELFQQDGSVAAHQLMKVGKDVLKAGIDTVREIIKLLIELIANLILQLRNLGNATIEIPIFSWLYKNKISGGHDLTLFDAVSLIIAFPTTVFAKLITGKAPPQIPSMDTQLLGKLVEGDSTLDSQVTTDFSILKAEIVVGITLTSGVFSVLKLLYKTSTGGVEASLEAQQEGPSGLFDIFGIAVNMISTIIAIPETNDLPGAAFRHCISYVSCVRGIYHSVFYFVPSNPATEEAVLCLDLLTVFAELGLNTGVFAAEKLGAANWKDYDEATCDTTMTTNGLNALAGVAYFAAFFFRDKNILAVISPAGAAVMTGCVGGAAVLEGVMFKAQYDLQKRIAIGSGPPF